MGEFNVSRSHRTSASPQAVHAMIDDFRHWTQWSPWEELDPAMERTYTGATEGVGAQYAWRGDKKAGAGSMRITESTPERIVIDLHFSEPFVSENTTVFTLVPTETGTDVTWTMTGPQSLAQKIMFALLRINRKVEKDFDKGLAALSAAATRA